MSAPMRSARILHIASHGYFNEKTPDIVGIATASVDSQNRPQPGFLSLTELLSKPFSNRLVVINGCDTLRGQQFNGEGLNSLTRGVLSQGAGSVISTLWSVTDRSSALFMTRFYQELKANGGDSVAALSETKRSFASRGRYKHPLFWAGYVLTVANKAFERPLE